MNGRSKTTGISAGILIVVLGALLFLPMLSIGPGRAIQTAERFVGFLNAHELQKAYHLTTQKNDVGKTLAEFKDIVDRQWPGGPIASVRFLEFKPGRSYWHHFRRWTSARGIGMREVSIEFSLDGIPFQVRETRTGIGEWKVVYFQSHAG